VTARTEKFRGVALCAVAYLVALAAAIAAGYVLRAQHPLVMIGGADAAGTLVIFTFSIGFNNSSFYDPYWSVAPMAIGVYWVVAAHLESISLVRPLIVFVLVWLWGARLTFNFLRGWKGLAHEDWRYMNLRAQNGRLYWPVSFAGIHFLPTIIVYLGCLPLYAICVAMPSEIGFLDGLAVLVTASAIALEALADEQLREFARTNKTPGRVLETGLWAHSRHPNYFGEILFWWGLFLFAIAAAPGQWWTGVGAVTITALFAFISIPMIEKRMRASKPEFANYARQTSILVPWRVRK